MPKKNGAPVSGRRNFLKTAGLAGAAAAATIAMPQISRAQTVTLKMQTSWPATDIFTEMAQQYVKRVNEMAGGRLKIDLLNGGAVVHPFQVLDGVHGGQIDARAYRDRLLVRQAQGRLAVRHRPGVRLQRQRGSRLDPQRRRQGAVRGTPDPDHEAQRQELLRHADADPAARLVQEAGHERQPTSRASSTAPSVLRPTCSRPWVPRSRSFRAAKSCRPWSAA